MFWNRTFLVTTLFCQYTHTHTQSLSPYSPYCIKSPWPLNLWIRSRCSSGKCYEPLVTTFPSSGQYVALFFYVCFCLKTSYFIHVGDSLTKTSRPTAVNWRLSRVYLTHIFSGRHHHLSVLRNTSQHFSPALRGAFKTPESPEISANMWIMLH